MTRRAAPLFALVAASLLAAAVWMQHLVGQARVDSVHLELGLRVGAPSMGCRLVGYNPLPFRLTIQRLELAVGRETAPLVLHVAPNSPLQLDAGRFEVSVPLVGSQSSTLVTVGKGFSAGAFTGLDYDGVMDVRWGPWEQTVRFEGKVQLL
jgi:hypothetical protein